MLLPMTDVKPQSINKHCMSLLEKDLRDEHNQGLFNSILHSSVPTHSMIMINSSNTSVRIANHPIPVPNRQNLVYHTMGPFNRARQVY